MVSISESLAWWILCSCIMFPIACGNQELSQNTASADDVNKPAEPPDEPQKAERPQIPDDAEYRAVITKLEELFPDDFKNARSKPRYKKPLAETLIKLAPGTHSSSERYVMLSESLKLLEADASEVASSIPLLMNCADALAAEFDVNSSGMKSDAFSRIGENARTTLSSIRQLSKVIIPSIQQAVDRDDYSSANAMLNTAESISKRLIDRKRKEELVGIRNDVAGLESQYKSFMDAESSLRQDAGNIEAHRIVGLYLGLRKGEWLHAERHIQLVGDAELQSLFVRTTAETRTAEATALLAEGWWNWAANRENIELKQARSFSGVLYASTFKELTGLSKIAAKDRQSYRESLPLVVTYNSAQPTNNESEPMADKAETTDSESKPSALPFTSREAKDLQTECAKSLGIPAAVTNSIGMKMVLIPRGRLRMEYEKSYQEVTLTKPIFIGSYEVTQADYERIMGTNPAELKHQHPRNPADHVSWDNANEFCQRLSAMQKEKSAGRSYRLPTEAEWEYACRAGTSSLYNFGEDQIGLGRHAWIETNSLMTPHPVGEKDPNAWGLFDMHGNVWEWCMDWYGDYTNSTVADPAGASSGEQRVIRGGSFYNAGTDSRSGSRNRSDQSARQSNLGFRVVFDLPDTGGQAK